MQSELARHFSSVRRNKGIRLGQLARMVGYRNVPKGANRIDRFEKWSRIHDNLLVKLADALGIDHQTVARLIAVDRRRYLDEWERWVNTPIRPSNILGHIGGFCYGEPIPEGLTQVAAEEYAASIAKQRKKPILLIVSRKLSIWFDAEGNRTSIVEAKPGDTALPYVCFGRRKVNIVFGVGMQPLNEPQMPGPEEVVTDFGGVRMRSTIIDGEAGRCTVITEGPYLPSDEQPTLADYHLGLETVMDRHRVFLDDDRLMELRDGIDSDAIMGQGSQLLGRIEDYLIALKVVSGPKRFPQKELLQLEDRT